MPKISMQGIGVPTPSGSSITDCWVEYKGSRTNEVPAGEEFVVRARGLANIPGQTTGCKILITAKSSDGTIAQYDDVNPTLWQTGPIYDSGNLHLKYDALVGRAQQNPIMPNHDITLYFKLWGNDHLATTYPPVSEW